MEDVLFFRLLQADSKNPGITRNPPVPAIFNFKYTIIHVLLQVYTCITHAHALIESADHLSAHALNLTNGLSARIPKSHVLQPSILYCAVIYPAAGFPQTVPADNSELDSGDPVGHT